MSALGIGLTEATMDVSYFGGNAVSVTLAPQEAATTTRLALGYDEVSVRCAIPAMSVTALGREERPPSHSPVNLDLEDHLERAARCGRHPGTNRAGGDAGRDRSANNRVDSVCNQLSRHLQHCPSSQTPWASPEVPPF